MWKCSLFSDERPTVEEGVGAACGIRGYSPIRYSSPPHPLSSSTTLFYPHNLSLRDPRDLSTMSAVYSCLIVYRLSNSERGTIGTKRFCVLHTDCSIVAGYGNFCFDHSLNKITCKMANLWLRMTASAHLWKSITETALSSSKCCSLIAAVFLAANDITNCVSKKSPASCLFPLILSALS